MKKVVLSLAALFGTIVMSAQEVKTAPVAPAKTRTEFVSLNFSAPTDGSSHSYPSIEFGHTTNDVSYSLVYGRGDFKNMFGHSDNLKNYFIEYKIVPSTTIGKMTFGFVVGAGTYLGKTADRNYTYFGEIGGVASYSINKFSVGTSFTNWANNWYLTPTLTYNY
jgi:hypothetical protein